MSDIGFEERLAHRILDARTRALAARDAKGERQETTKRVLAFTLGDDLYGLPMADVARVIPFGGYTPVPGARPGVLGIIGVRGQIHTALDASTLLHGAPRDAAGAAGHLILLRRPPPRLALSCTRAIGVADIVMLAATEQPVEAASAVAEYGRVADDSMAPAGTTVAVIDLVRLLAAFRSDKQESLR